MKNKILLVLGIIAAAIAIFILYYFDGIGKRVRREDVDCLCCP